MSTATVPFRFVQTLSIIGSRQVFELEFISMRARDLFAERLFYFVLENIFNNPKYRQQLQQRDRSLAVQRQQSGLLHLHLREDENVLDGIDTEVEHKRDTAPTKVSPRSPPPPPIEEKRGCQ